MLTPLEIIQVHPAAAAVAVGDKIYYFGGSLTNENIASNTPMDVRVLKIGIRYL